MCARQWRECVVRAQESFAALGVPGREVRYESLISKPLQTLAELAAFAGFSPTSPELAAAGQIRPGRTGIGRLSLSDGEARRVDVQVGQPLPSLGYDRAVLDAHIPNDKDQTES